MAKMNDLSNDYGLWQTPIANSGYIAAQSPALAEGEKSGTLIEFDVGLELADGRARPASARKFPPSGR